MSWINVPFSVDLYAKNSTETVGIEEKKGPTVMNSIKTTLLLSETAAETYHRQKKQLGRDLKLPRVRNGINKKERQASAASGPIVLDSRRCPFTLSVFFFLSFFVFFFFCSASPARHLRLVFSPFPSALVVAVVSCIIHSNWRNSFTSCSHVAVPLLFLRPIFTYFCRVCYF